MPDAELGLTIEQALKTFTSAELRDRLDEAEKAFPEDQRKKYVLDSLDFMNGALDSALSKAYKNWDVAQRAVEADLRQRLVAGELVGFVFLPLISPDDERIQVSQDRWRHAQLYRTTGNARVHGEIYRDVKIWRASDLESLRNPATYSSGKARSDCERWLRNLVERGGPEKPKGKYREEATQMFVGLSGRGFNGAWDVVTRGHDEWRRPGRKKKKPQ